MTTTAWVLLAAAGLTLYWASQQTATTNDARFSRAIKNRMNGIADNTAGQPQPSDTPNGYNNQSGRYSTGFNFQG